MLSSGPTGGVGASQSVEELLSPLQGRSPGWPDAGVVELPSCPATVSGQLLRGAGPATLGGDRKLRVGLMEGQPSKGGHEELGPGTPRDEARGAAGQGDSLRPILHLPGDDPSAAPSLGTPFPVFLQEMSLALPVVGLLPTPQGHLPAPDSELARTAGLLPALWPFLQDSMSGSFSGL